MTNLDLHISRKQREFIGATADEVIFGGAAGGGKSYGQLIDALLYSMKYPKSKQLILRRTFPDLEKSLVRVALGLYPREIFSYNASNHVGRFMNGSLIDFGYCANENDVFQYQGAEYDTIRFDELTHFTEFQYTYLLSRLRGANDFPKQIKSSTNPGGVGHAWVKSRFIDPAPPKTVFKGEDGMTRIFIPSRVDDNKYLLASDANYKRRLEALPDAQRRALLHGDWDIFEGQFYSEWCRETMVVQPFPIPREWRVYQAFDYGLDRLACLWIAVDSTRTCYVFREECESNLPISEAAKRMLDGDKPYVTLAPPDMWGRSQESGKSKADLFYEAGLRLTKSSNDREAGWLAIKELMKKDANGECRLKIFSTCTELIKCLPMLQIDPRRPTDCMTQPHEITHAPDALRYFAVYWSRPAEEQAKVTRRAWTDDMWQDYYAADEDGKKYLKRKYGEPL